ncbi:hypothetical protein TNCV_313971 [Trichonephila clavipes]|nr:hypothetical protein TNCV_313971 [Trichonephila clavipes]
MINWRLAAVGVMWRFFSLEAMLKFWDDFVCYGKIFILCRRPPVAKKGYYLLLLLPIDGRGCQCYGLLPRGRSPIHAH